MPASQKNSFKGKENEAENRDFFGSKWQLAPGGKKRVDTSQSRVWDLHVEINAIGALFRNMQTCDMSADEYYGISLCLLRIGKRLGRISDELSKVVIEAAPEEK